MEAFRDKAAVDLYLGLGVDRVILGSVALKNPELTKQVIAEYGAERIVIGVDGKMVRSLLKVGSINPTYL